MSEGSRSPSIALGNDFRFYASGRAVSEIGDRIALIALVFLVIRLSNNQAFALGLFYLARLLPTLLGGLVAGVIADHFSRRPLMIACDLGRALLLVAVPALSSLTLWTVYPLVVALYTLTLLFDTAARAALPDVVPEAGMTRANALLQAIDSSTDIAYAVGGSLVYALNLRTPFYIDAVTFLFSALMVSRMSIPSLATGPLPRLRAVWMRMRDGLAYLLASPFLKWSSAAFGLAPLAGGAMFVLVPLYAEKVLSGANLSGPFKSGVFRFSMLEVSLGLGALLGTLLTVRLARHWPRGRLFGIGLLGMGCVDLSFAAITNLFVAMPVMALHGICNSLFLICGVTLVQQLTPSELRGRVIAARSTIIYSALGIGSAVGGVLLTWLSYRTMWLVLGSVIALSSVFIWLRPDVRNQE